MSDVAVFPNIARPDLILPPGVMSADPLEPCQACGASQKDAPEGVHDVFSLKKYPHTPGTSDDGTKAGELNAGDAKWQATHCFKCGYRPGANVVVPQSVLKAEFDAFKEKMAHILGAMYEERQKGFVTPDTDAEKELLRQQLAEGAAENARLRAQLNEPPEGV